MKIIQNEMRATLVVNAFFQITNVYYHATRKQVNIQNSFQSNDNFKMIYIKIKSYASYIFAALYLYLKEQFWNKKNVFCVLDNQILELQNLNSQIILSNLSHKHETRNTFYLVTWKGNTLWQWNTFYLVTWKGNTLWQWNTFYLITWKGNTLWQWNTFYLVTWKGNTPWQWNVANLCNIAQENFLSKNSSSRTVFLFHWTLCKKESVKVCMLTYWHILMVLLFHIHFISYQFVSKISFSNKDCA